MGFSVTNKLIPSLRRAAHFLVVGTIASLLGCADAIPQFRETIKEGAQRPAQSGRGSEQPHTEIHVPQEDQGPFAEDELTANPNHSLGSGGAIGAIENNFTASNGLSSRYRTIIPEDISMEKAYGLSIHLHGDGGGDYNWLYRPNVSIARKHGLIGIVVMAPNRGRRWYNQGVANAAFLNELIQEELFANYNIDRTRVYFTGVSGGAQFLTGQFIPLYGHRYNSGALMLCGGPRNWQRQLEGDSSFRQRFKLYWYSGTADFLYNQIVTGMRYYQDQGFQVGSEMIPGAAHCRFPGGVAGALERKLPKIIK